VEHGQALLRHDRLLAVARDSGGRLRTDRLKIGLRQKGKVQNLSDAIVEECRSQEEVCALLNGISLRTLQRDQAEALDLLATFAKVIQANRQWGAFSMECDYGVWNHSKESTAK
jgi:hypothetical protein